MRNADNALANLAQPYDAPIIALPVHGTEDGGTNEAWFPAPHYLRFSEAREHTGLDLLLLRLALRACILDRGAAPKSLDHLVPRYLKKVPRDAFADGAPLRYVASGRTYRLWSVGPDGKNDNGTPVPPLAGARPEPELVGRLPNVLHKSKGDWVAGENQ